MSADRVIRTPDQRVRVFVSSTLGELAEERRAVRAAIEALQLAPVMFELGARPHPPRELYRAYLAQSHVFVGIYWQRYGWVAPGEDVSGLEDEYRLAGNRPRLIYLKHPATEREPRLDELLAAVQADDLASYKHFRTTEELASLVRTDLAVMLSERFEAAVTATSDGDLVPPPRVPAPLTPTIGREGEIATVAGLLDDGVRLVTLTGVGGIGKTRVAQEVALASARREAGEVQLVQLAAVTEPAHVVPTIADQLGARTAGQQRHLDALAERLGTAPTLLVLDNLEQVVAAAPDVVELLRRCPGLQVLVTSRQALRVEGEHEVPLAPLRRPTDENALERVGATPAVRLFVDRARAVRPGFRLTDGNVHDIVEISHLLDGLPLAIELAAARVRLLTPSQLRGRLTDRLDLLVGGGDRPSRQRTLRATIDWSHQLLAPDEQVLFARLSVFAGGCTLEAAEEVCGLEDDAPVLDALAGLIDKSLVLVEEQDEPRFRMLETVRAYAAERLAERGEQGQLPDRHLEYFRRFTDRAQPYLCGPQQLEWSARVDPERPNLRAAIAHALARGRVATVVDMAWDLYVYYFLRGAHRETAAWIHAAHERRELLGPERRAILEAALAIDDVTRGDFASARRRLVPALELFDAQGMTLERAVAHMYLGLIDLGHGDLSDAIRAEETASGHFLAIDHDWGAASSEAYLGLMHWLDGDQPRARHHYERSLAFAERIRNEQLAGQAMVGRAATALDEDDLAAAMADLSRAVPLMERCGDAAGASMALDVLAAAALAAGRPGVALHALQIAAGARARLEIPLHRALQDRVDRLRDASRHRAGDTAAWPGPVVDADPVASLPQLLAAAAD